MEFLNFLNANSGAIGVISGAISVIVTIVLAIFTIRYARLTRQSQELVEKLIDNPKVVASLRNDEVNSSCLIVCIENVGTGTARNVRFQTNFSFQIMGDISLEDIGFLKKGIDYFGSGQKFEFLVNTIMGKEAWEELMQTPLAITITYLDSTGEEHVEKAYLDFGAFENLPLPKSPIGAIAETTKEMVKVTKEMVKATKGIGKELNQSTRIRIGDKVRTRDELRAVIDGDLRQRTTIPKGVICTVLEVTPDEITIEWDDAHDESGGRVVYRNWRFSPEPFEVVAFKLPPQPSAVIDDSLSSKGNMNISEPERLN